MRYAVYADVHSNLEAFEAVLKAAKEDGARAHYCAGDVVGYGADPDACIELIRQNRVQWVAGNHDLAVAGKLGCDSFSEHAKDAVYWTRANIKPEHVRYLQAGRLVYKNDDFIMVHGTLNRPEDFQYFTDTAMALDTFYLMDRNVCFIGHTHVPQIVCKKKIISLVQETVCEIDDGAKYIVNVGSVGQPRDGNPLASYCIYDPDLQRVEIKRVSYDVEAAQRKIIQARLPEMLAKRLSVGQ